MINSILVPVDGSTHSRKALDLGCDLAKKYSAKLCVVHVVDDEHARRQVMVLGSSHVMLPVDPQVVEQAGQAVLEDVKSVVAAQGGEVHSADVVAGSAAREILATADKRSVDTIIMGSRGLSDIAGLLMGSVSHKVSHLATCTCIVVR